MSKTREVVVLLDLVHCYDRGILQGIGAFARDHRTWSVVVEEVHRQRIPDLREWRGDGLIVNFDDRRVAEAVRSVNLPVVGVGGGRGWYDDRSGIPYVATDDEAIGRLAAEHLLEQGLRNFGFCGFPANRTNVWIANRAQSFVARVNAAGCQCEIFNGRFSATGAVRHWGRMRAELADWLRALPKPVGLLGCNDWRARHVLEACRVAGLRVPDDVAGVGVDNHPICEIVPPPLTSVEQGHYQIGYTAATILDQIMGGQPGQQRRYCVPPVGLVSRQSTDLLAVEDPEVAKGLRMIREQDIRLLKAEVVAATVGLSRSTLDLRFKQNIGRTVNQEIRRARLARAKELLARTTWPVRRVAREAGFGNEQYLSAVLRRDDGCTPAKYRQTHRAKSLS
jgi:LacI family transcriptional regulator